MWIILGSRNVEQFDLDIDLWPQFEKNRVQNISLILVEVGIPNLVCEYTLRPRSVAYFFSGQCHIDIDIWLQF